MKSVLLPLLACFLCSCDSLKSKPAEPTVALLKQSSLSIPDDAAFQNAFTGEPQCKGITLINNGENRADFVVLSNKNKSDESWD